MIRSATSVARKWEDTGGLDPMSDQGGRVHFFTRARRVAGPSVSRRAGVVLPMALAFVLVLGAVAWADNVQNDLASDPAGRDTFTAGGSTTISYRIVATSGDGQNGCNASDGSPATVTINTPVGVTASPNPLTINACTPSAFPTTFSSNTPGNHTITVSVADSGPGTYNVNPATFTLKVLAPPSDTTPPVLSGVPTDMTVEGNTTGGANVSWAAPTATDTVDPSPAVGCSPASGSFFALGGPHTVTCTATDAAGNSAGQSFSVTVVDTTPPVLSGVPSNMVVEGNTTGGANVSWAVPTAADIVDPAPTVGCSPASGSFFALGGPHTVTCTATDAAGNSASQSFDISVVDTTAPTLSGVPSNMTVAAASAGQKTVSWTSPTATDTVDPSPTVGCTPASGSSFSIGTTKVTCTATDASGNSSSQSFDVTVVYDFTGFFRPVDNLPTINVAKAGSAIPVKFSLSGDQGLLIYEAGYPKVQTIACDSLAPSDTVEETVTAPSSGLSYDAASDQYNYVWKTNKSWSGCRQLQMKLKDGREYVANFRFTK